MRVNLIFGCVLGAALVVGVGVSVSTAQAPELSGSGLGPTPQPAWLTKVNAAISDTTELVLTAEETAVMVAAYSRAFQRQPGDMALSTTTCYVLAVDGTVLMSTPLRQ